MKSKDYVFDRWDTAFLVFSLLGVLGNLALTLLGLGTSLITLIFGDQAGATTFFWSSMSFAPLVLLGAPAVYLGVRAVTGFPPPKSSRFSKLWIVGLIIFPLAIGLGYLSFELDFLYGAFAPLAHFLAAVSPVLIVISLAKKWGPSISLRRTLGHTLIGVWGVPPVALAAEIILVLIVGVFVVGLISFNPEGRHLLDLILNIDPETPQALEYLLQLIAQPGVFITLIAFFSILIPLLEETLKSMAIWPLLARDLSPGEAFLGGVLGGAGFALFESLFLPQPGGEWIATMVGRSGTAFIHAFTTGLVCLGIAGLKTGRKWKPFVLNFLAAVFLHGFWNTSALGIGIGAFPQDVSTTLGLPGDMSVLGTIGVLILIGLTLSCLTGIVFLSRKLRASETIEPLG